MLWLWFVKSALCWFVLAMVLAWVSGSTRFGEKAEVASEISYYCGFLPSAFAALYFGYKYV